MPTNDEKRAALEAELDKPYLRPAVLDTVNRQIAALDAEDELPTARVDETADFGDNTPYAISELGGVRVLLYRNTGGWVSVQIETDADEDNDNLCIMLNDADLHEGSRTR